MSGDHLQLPPLNVRRVIVATVAVVALTLALWLLFRFRIAILLLFIAIFLSTAMKPAVAWLHARGLPRPAGISVVYAIVLALVIIFTVLVVPLVADQGTRIVEAIPTAYDRARVWMIYRPNLLILRLGSELPEALPLNSPEPRNGEEAAAVLQQTWRYLLLSGKVVFGVALTLIMAFYWTLDGERLKRGFLLLLPQERREGVRTMIAEMGAKLARYTSGLLLLVAAVGTLSFFAYLIIDLPYALLLALIAAIMEAIPVLGPALGAIPALLVAFSISPLHALWVLIATLAIQQIENNLLFPRVMGQAVGVHPVVTLLAFVAFGLLFGIPGALVALPLAAVVQVVFDRYLLDPELRVAPEPEGRDALSVLRYDTQELVADVRKRAREADDADTEQMILEDEVEGLALELEQILGALKKADNAEV